MFVKRAGPRQQKSICISVAEAENLGILIRKTIILFFCISRRLFYPIIYLSCYFQCFVTAVYIAIGSAVALLEYLGFAGTLNSVVAVGNVLYLRWRYPDKTRPYKVRQAFT